MQTDAGVTRCPQCAQQVPVDPRYVTWCDKCDWNVDPSATDRPEPTWRQRLEHRLADTLYRELEHGHLHRPGWDAARIGAWLLSGLVLLLPLAALLAGIALLVFYRPLWLSILLALIPLSLALLLRPRAHRLDPDAHLVERDSAPTLFALLDELARTIGTKPVTAVVVDPEPTVYFARIGWRFRPVIGLGLPLWAGLGPQERVAILAHELGHGKNGDARHGWMVNAAGSVLYELRQTFSEQPLDRYRQELADAMWADPTPAGLVTRIVNATVGGGVRSYSWLLGKLDLRSSQRAEYLADRKAAEIAGSDATAWALERTLLADASYRALERSLRFDKGIQPLEAVRRAVAEVPAREIERRVRLSRLQDTRIDSTHPPTYLRTKLIRARPAQRALVVLTNDRSRAIDGELATTADAVLKELRTELR
ncbi:Zn-dependent protease with chaperone function [Kribbella voronezhensis]|uniref:Zn-dependent protease with chaperone function n=1 Tax=Kribbella voronezhensis TaxID=2512212 RepID=A0A4R7TFQ5_9ACTN|nr:M48 family metallopeptidase [Kribbella voronezhensis]TDU91024.1 Zn-dependent protease with chaperone function [Kribbella voronezhensis]